jgi:nucleoside-diphosphate-sugar epimerase
MRVAVTGASGNVGTSLLRALALDPEIESVVGICRRLPALQVPKVEWRTADVSRDALVPLFAGADVVVHLAWLVQPSRDLATLQATNVHGSARVFAATAEARVGSLVYASSVGAYSPGPKDRAVDEAWPTDGIATSFYSAHKAAVERILDRFEREHPEVRSVRLRPALIFKRTSASEQRRLFAGPLIPTFLLRPKLIPVVPDVPRLRFQAVHADDIAEAYRRTIVGDAHGAYNVAADPVLDPDRLARLFHARKVPVPPKLLRAAVAASWRLHLQPTPEGWVDMALAVPTMSTRRVREELGWQPRRTAEEAVLELLEGMREGRGDATPPMERGGSGPVRIREFLTGIGSSRRP